MGPGSIAIYGRPKVGKTVVANQCFTRAIVLECEPGATNSVQSVLGRKPPTIPCLDVDNPFRQVEDAIKNKLPKLIKEHNASAIIVDTGSDYADRIFACYDQQLNHNGMVTYPRTATDVKMTFRRLLSLGLWVVGIFHEREPRTLSGKFYRGGPKLPGSLLEDMPGLFDMILRATIELNPAAVTSGFDDPKTAPPTNAEKFRRVFTASGLESEWITGDRFNVTKPKQPMDLRPLLWRIVNDGQEVPDELLKRLGHDPAEWK